MKVNRLLADVRFWIVFFFVIRLIGITNPPLEVGHNWRQTTVTMVSRNFLEIDNNILYPRIDIAGEKTGITGMEFPLLNYMIYLSAELFGYQHWYGRLINLIISSLGLWFFYKLVRKYFPEKVALYSTIILTVSIWFQFSRKIMPDTFSMSMIIACIYYGTHYLETRVRREQLLYLAAYFVLMVLGTLSKISSAYLLVVFAIPFLHREIPLDIKGIFAVVSLAGLVPVVIWYFYWVPHLVETYQFWHFFMGKSFGEGWTEIMQNFPETLRRFYETPLKFIGFAAFLYGLIFAVVKKDWRIYTIFALAMASFSLIVIKTGYNFPHHNYYVIPFVPVMALVAGYGLTQIPYKGVAIFILVAIAAEGIGNQQHDFRIRESSARLVNLADHLDQFSERSDLILINSGQYPTPMYFAHRKGWVESNDFIAHQENLHELINKGLRFIVILKRSFGTPIALHQFEQVFDNEDYTIYQVQ